MSKFPPLWDHQKKAIAAARSLPYFGLFFDVGTGKTRTAIEILFDKYVLHGKILPTFIFCPPVVIQNWADEFKKYKDISDDHLRPLMGPSPWRLKHLQTARPDSIFIMNYETLLMKTVYDEMVFRMRRAASAGDPCCIVADELHKIKSHDSKRSKAMHKLAEHAEYRFGLTGTPILNSLEDLFSEFLFLDRGERFGKNYWVFRKRYFHDKNANMPKHMHFPNWVVKPEAKEQMLALAGTCSQSAKKSECLDLPPLVRKIVHVSLSKSQAKVYEEMRDDLLTTISHGDRPAISIAETTLTKALRLQQIVSGHLRVQTEGDPEMKTVSIKDNPRKDALKQLLEDIAPNEKVIVWAVFKDNYRDIREVCEALDIRYVELHGDVGTAEKHINVKAFNEDESVRVLIGHPGSGGIGVNLIASSCAIFYSRAFNLEYDIQAEGRNYRGGSERHEKVTRIDLVAKGTIDEVVLKSLENKTELNESMLRNKLEEL